jgi:hypothetical protein
MCGENGITLWIDWSGGVLTRRFKNLWSDIWLLISLQIFRIHPSPSTVLKSGACVLVQYFPFGFECVKRIFGGVWSIMKLYQLQRLVNEVITFTTSGKLIKRLNRRWNKYDTADSIIYSNWNITICLCRTEYIGDLWRVFGRVKQYFTTWLCGTDYIKDL